MYCLKSNTRFGSPRRRRGSGQPTTRRRLPPVPGHHNGISGPFPFTYAEHQEEEDNCSWGSGSNEGRSKIRAEIYAKNSLVPKLARQLSLWESVIGSGIR